MTTATPNAGLTPDATTRAASESTDRAISSAVARGPCAIAAASAPTVNHRLNVYMFRTNIETISP
jgi:hypothetical protein